MFTNKEPVVPYRGVHLDLKGLPPTPERLLSLLDLFSAIRLNVVLVEWEDTFPWTVDERFRGSAAYSPEIVKRFCERAGELGIELIPLVQTLGHMETPLRIADYAKLRELPDDPAGLNPLAEGAQDLLSGMIEDVLALMPDLKHFHLGADEAWTLGQHPDTGEFLKSNCRGTLLNQHLGPLMQILEKRNIRPIIWHDMLVKAEDEALRQMAPRCDLLAWGYQGHPDESQSHNKTAHIRRLHDIGFTLWGGTAYKGADGYNSDLPDPVRRAVNATAWADMAKRFGLKGIISTAWSRYSTHIVQCEPIDAALDCLVESAVIMHDGTPPAGGIEACRKALAGFGEEERFDACYDAMSKLSELRNNGWKAVQNIRELKTLHDMDPPRSIGNKMYVAVNRLEEIVKESDEVDNTVRSAFAGLLPDCSINEYLKTRLQPLRDELKLLG